MPPDSKTTTSRERSTAVRPPGFEPSAVLCAIDLSAMSSTVLKWARLFTETYHAAVEVVHTEMTDYPQYFLPAQEEQLTAETDQRSTVLRHQLAELARNELGTDIQVKATILDGYAAEAILKHAALSKPDLIIMGSHGHSGFNRIRLGSVVETVMRTTRVPVLAARNRADGLAPRIARVLCPVSFAESAYRCLTLSADVASAFRAQLVAVHAVEDTNLDLNAGYEALCRWVPSEVRKKCDVIEVIRHGNAAEQILLAAHEQAADLIVLDTERHPFLDFAIPGTTAEQVIRRAESAVLVFPTRNEVAT